MMETIMPPRTCGLSSATRVVALDFETEYTTKYSVKTMGTWAYVHDPRFKATQVAAYNDDVSRSCAVADFDWSLINGARIAAHHAGFDRAVFERLQALGKIPEDVRPAGWICTSALSRFCNGPASLKDCAKAWLGLEIDKSIRDRMADATPDLFDRHKLADYALTDANICWQLYVLLIGQWPEHEQRLCELTRAMGEHGVFLDLDYVAQCRGVLSTLGREHTSRLPWTAEGRPALSIPAFAAEYRKLGIEPPASTAKTETGLVRWKLQHKDSPAIGWLKAMQSARRTNRTLKVFEAMASRVKPDGRMSYDLLYCGATTGRWSGAGGLNMQNFNRDSVGEDIDLRAAITAPPGHVLVIIDYAQIESRVLLWLAGDQATLDVLRSGIDIYEAHARTTMGYIDPRPLKDVDKHLRQLAKARVLGLGYGCGAEKFIVVAKTMGGIDLTFENSRRMVNDYRRSNPLITQLWSRLEAAFSRCHGKTYQLPLPSGRRLRYHNVDANLMTAESIKGESEDFYGGKLTENFVSAVARDILAHAWLALHDAGFKVVLSVHDELVIECREESQITTKDLCEAIMLTTPPWAKELPLAVEGVISRRYVK